MRSFRGLVEACHPLPTFAVTVFAMAYAFAVEGAFSAAGLSVGLAILAGQLCVGWSNDALDADRDLRAGRLEKPITAGLVGVQVVRAAAFLAAAAAILLSARLENGAGLCHLIALLSALGYNARLKGTLASPLPYLVSFGLLPVIASLAVLAEPPPVATVVAAALLGAGAHFANTVGDTEADELTGVRGLPQLLGPARSLSLMAVLIGLAAGCLLIGVLGADLGLWRKSLAVLLLGAGVALASVGAVGRGPGGYGAFRLTIGAVALVVAGFLLAA